MRHRFDRMILVIVVQSGAEELGKAVRERDERTWLNSWMCDVREYALYQLLENWKKKDVQLRSRSIISIGLLVPSFQSKSFNWSSFTSMDSTDSSSRMGIRLWPLLGVGVGVLAVVWLRIAMVECEGRWYWQYDRLGLMSPWIRNTTNVQGKHMLIRGCSLIPDGDALFSTVPSKFCK